MDERTEILLTSEIPDMWYDIVLETHHRLIDLDPKYEILQIKEKFGGLRYYYESDIPYSSRKRTRMEEIIEEAELQVEELEANLNRLRKSNIAAENAANEASVLRPVQRWDNEGGSMPEDVD